MSDVLADTNVLVRWALAHDPLGEVARRAVERLLRTRHTRPAPEYGSDISIVIESGLPRAALADSRILVVR